MSELRSVAPDREYGHSYQASPPDTKAFLGQQAANLDPAMLEFLKQLKSAAPSVQEQVISKLDPAAQAAVRMLLEHLPS